MSVSVIELHHAALHYSALLYVSAHRTSAVGGRGHHGLRSLAAPANECQIVGIIGDTSICFQLPAITSYFTQLLVFVLATFADAVRLTTRLVFCVSVHNSSYQAVPQT